MCTPIGLIFGVFGFVITLGFSGSPAQANGPEFLESYLHPSNRQTVFATGRAMSEQIQAYELPGKLAPETATATGPRSAQRAAEGSSASTGVGSAEASSPGAEVLSLRALGAVFKVSQPYGAVDREVNPTPGGVHAGIDLAAPLGTAVRAVRDGTVINAGGPYGTVAVFDGQNTVLYLHMNDINLLTLHKSVTVGTYLGTVDRVGATGVHLHIEVRKGRQEVGVGCTKEEYRKTPAKGAVSSPKGYCESSRRIADLTLDPVAYLVGAQQAEAAGRQPPARKEEGTGGASGPAMIEVRRLSDKFFLFFSGTDAPSGTTFWLYSNDRSNRCSDMEDAMVLGEVPSFDRLADETVARSLILKGARAYQDVCQPENTRISVWLWPEGHIRLDTQGGLNISPPFVVGNVFRGAITAYQNRASGEEQRKPHAASGQQAEGGGVGTGAPVQWSVRPHVFRDACENRGYPVYLHVMGKVPAAIDLTDDQIAKTLLDTGREYALANCPMLRIPRQDKSVTVYLYTPSYRGGQEPAAQGYFAFGSQRDVYENYAAAEAARQRARRDWHARWIEPFLRKYGVEVWIDSPEMKSRLASNPFQWKGKIVGLVAEFGVMLTQDSGVFSLGPDLAFVAVKGLPSARFTRSGIQFLLAGRVQGTSQVQLPFLGSTPVPELNFIGAEPAPPPMPR